MKQKTAWSVNMPYLTSGLCERLQAILTTEAEYHLNST